MSVKKITKKELDLCKTIDDYRNLYDKRYPKSTIGKREKWVASVMENKIG